MTDPLPQMIAALGLEVAAIRKTGGGQRIELRGGERVGPADGSWLYRFVVPDDLQLRDETPVRVTVEQEDVPGIAVSFRDGVLVVALEKDLGAVIASARVIANDSFLIERLKERLEKAVRGQAWLGRSAAERVLGLDPPRSGDAEPHPAVLEDGLANADQVRAVRRSLGSDTTYIWGPPGTGKTTTLARIVEAHYRAGRSVLLVSNTNIAVDTALERVAERLAGETDFHQGLVIRQGPVVKEELRRRFGPQVILEAIVERLGTSLRLEKETLGTKAPPLESEERALMSALAEVERLKHARHTLATRETARDVTSARADARERQVKQYRDTSARLRADLERAQAMGVVRRFFTGLNPEKLKREAAASDRSAQAAAEAGEALAAQLLQHESELADLRAEVDRLVAETGTNPPVAGIQVKLEALRKRLTQIRERMAAIESELAELEPRVLNRCRILATTVYRSYLGKSDSRQFDAVVIDEASMLMPPLVYHAAGLATQSVTVAGDFRQLPPIVMSGAPLAAEWLKQDVFEKVGIPQRLAKRQPMPYLVVLGTQYRMREPICAVINELFYSDHPLRSDPSVRFGGEGFSLSSSPLLYVDTAPFHPWTSMRVGSYSRYNLFHALLARNIVVHLAEMGFLPPAGVPNDAVGVVAPYAAQVRLIQALLDDRLGPRAAGIAATVHRFQGNEKRVMLLDLTDSLGAPLGRFLQATRIEEDGARLLNVAVSRARHHVILIANFDYLRRKAPASGLTRRLVDHFEKHGEALELKRLLPLVERDWVDGLHRMLPATFDFQDSAAGAFTEGTFYPAFLKDLGRARESIVIFSPFATGRGTGRWVNALRAALARGVRVRILTRPAEEVGHGGTDEVVELVRGLRGLGVSVDLRARMHEKIAILDQRVLWHGSLNILSHRDTHESMLRIESPAACSQLARFVSEPGSRRDDAPALEVSENPACPTCGGATVWNSGRNGIYFECEDPDCGGEVHARRRGGADGRENEVRGSTKDRDGSRGADKGAAAGRPCPREGCDGHLAERNGRFGRFLACSRYPGCRYTEDVEG